MVFVIFFLFYQNETAQSSPSLIVKLRRASISVTTRESFTLLRFLFANSPVLIKNLLSCGRASNLDISWARETKSSSNLYESAPRNNRV
jgi:hypothetical protein